MILLGLMAGGEYYYYINDTLSQPEEAVEEVLATAEVRREDIVITAFGVGTLLPAKVVNLGFDTSGTIAEVAVQVGDLPLKRALD